MNLQYHKNTLARKLCSMPISDAIQAGICIECKQDALPKCYSLVGKKEYYISGLCEHCFFNSITKEK